MPKDRAGSVIWNKARTLASARLRVPGFVGRLTFPMPHSSGSQAEAEARCKVLNDIAQRMASLDVVIAKDLLTQIAAVPEQKLRAACAGADRFIGGYRPPSSAPTLRQVGKRWTGGELHAEYKDDVESMSVRSADGTDELLEKWVYKIIGDLPVDQIDLDAADRVKKYLSQSELEDSSRANVLARFRALMNICVYPLKLINRTPLPPGWVPRKPKRRAFALLYSDDITDLLGCALISVHWRMFWGFLALEGPRPHNATEMRVRHLDLVHDGVHFDDTKTDERIIFSLTEGTGDAFRAYLKKFRPNARPDDYLLIDDNGGPIPLKRIASIFRKHLLLAELHKRRPELIEDTEHRRHAVAYDLKASFITVKRAVGWKDSQVIEHTGHVDTRMLKTYTRLAKTYAQLRLARHDFLPLIAAIPELQGSPDGDDFESGKSGPIGQGLATIFPKPAISLANGKFSQDFVLGFQLPDMPKTPKNVHPIKQSSPADTDPNGHTAANPERLDMHAMVQRLGYELAVERGVSQRFAEAIATMHQGLELQLAATVSAATVAAVIGELQRKGIINRPKPVLVKVEADPADDATENADADAADADDEPEV